MSIRIAKVEEYINKGGIRDFILNNLNIPVFQLYKSSVDDTITSFIKELRPELTIVVETEYVDRVYRDCYYNLYSKKNHDYSRDCIRVSILDEEINTADLYSAESIRKIKDGYLGFFVIRPLAVGSIGRNCINPKALLSVNQDIVVCKTTIKTSCLGVKVQVDGFPHSSQDSEYMSCAETTTWELLEYFGNKYNNSQIVLPSSVLGNIERDSMVRQIPTEGLNLYQMSYALKEQGFECKIYSNRDPAFHELLNCYIESGIPLAVALKLKTSGHAVACIGHTTVDRSTMTKSADIDGTTCYKWNENIESLVFSDDNYSAYQKTTYTSPTAYYTDPNFAGACITSFVVPLPKKVYVPADIAIEASSFIAKYICKIADGTHLKTFLVSSRSFREYIINNPDLSNEYKLAILDIHMPRFVWITEIADNPSFLKGKVNGIIVIDATGNIKTQGLNSLIYVQMPSFLTYFDRSTKNFAKFLLPLPPSFQEFQGNLK